MFNTAKIAETLSKHLGRKLEYTESPHPQDADGEVKITDSVSVQVGHDFLCVVKQLDDGNFSFFPGRTKKDALQSVLDDLIKAGITINTIPATPADETIRYAIGSYGFLIPRGTQNTATEFAALIRNYSEHPRSVIVAEAVERSNLEFAHGKDGTVSARKATASQQQLSEQETVLNFRPLPGPKIERTEPGKVPKH